MAGDGGKRLRRHGHGVGETIISGSEKKLNGTFDYLILEVEEENSSEQGIEIFEEQLWTEIAVFSPSTFQGKFLFFLSFV